MTTPTNATTELPRIVDVEVERLFTGTKDQFLNTTPNHEALIRLISDKLCQNGCNVMQASGDADMDIVEAEVSPSLTKSTTLMERIQIFCCFSFSTHQVFKIDSTSGLTNQKTTLHRITVLKSVLRNDISKQLIFAHAFTYGVIPRIT